MKVPKYQFEQFEREVISLIYIYMVTALFAWFFIVFLYGHSYGGFFFSELIPDYKVS